MKATGSGIPSQLRGKFYSEEKDEEGDNAEQRVPVGTKGEIVL